MQDPKSLDDAFSAAIARVQATQAAQPSPIESIFKNAIARAKAGNHYSQQRQFSPHTKPAKPSKQRTTNGLSVLISKALYDQLERFCTEHNMPRSKAVRRAVYEMMRNPKQTAPRLSKLAYAPKRNAAVNWSLSRDREELDAVCADMNITASEFQRKAIYLYTKANVSKDATEAREAAADGWGIPNT
jgi:hypothetical protein